MNTFLDHDEDAGTPRRGGLLAGLVLGVFLLLGLAAYVGTYRYAEDHVPLGTRVEGVSIGGLSPADATARMRAQFGPALHRPVSFAHEGTRYQLVPAKVGVSIDYAATVRAAGGGVRSIRPSRLWDFLAGGGMAEPVVRIDKKTFDAALLELTRKVGRPEIEGDIDFSTGHPRPVYGQSGISIDHKTMRRLVTRLVFAGSGAADAPVAELPVVRKEPYVSAVEVERAMRAFGRPAMSGPVTIRIGGHSVVATPKLFGPALEMAPNQGRLVPLLDGDELVDALQPAMTTVGDEPRNARVEIVGRPPGHPRVVPAVIGASFDSQRLAKKFVAHLTKRGRARTFTLHAAVQRPKVSTKEAEAWGITARVGSATVPVGSGSSGSSGFSGVAGASGADALDGRLLRPGRTLTVSRVLGDRDPVLASAVFAAAVRAGYPIDDRVAVHRHRTGLAVGLEAADVTVRNDGEHPVLVNVERSGGAVTVSLWSARDRHARVHVGRHTDRVAAPVRVETGPGCTPRAGTDGFSVVVRRTVVRGGSRTHDAFSMTYDPVAGVRCS